MTLVGPNGTETSTVLKLMSGELLIADRMIWKHSHVKRVHYHQHLQEQVDLDLLPLECMMNAIQRTRWRKKWRRWLYNWSHWETAGHSSPEPIWWAEVLRVSGLAECPHALLGWTGYWYHLRVVWCWSVMVSNSISKLHKNCSSVRSRQSPGGLETTWSTRRTSSPSWWPRSPNSQGGPTTCEPLPAP